MAGKLSFNDLIPKITKKIEVQGRFGGFLRFDVKGIPEKQLFERFKVATERASNIIASDLKIALDEAMRSDIWQTLSGTADIIDTGRLMDSGVISINKNGLTIAYTEPYAALVHYGGYITPYGNEAAMKIYLPPRPWIEAVLTGNGPVEGFDFAKYYKREIELEFKR